MVKLNVIKFLIGEVLFEKVKELGDLFKEEKVKICGYVIFIKKGLFWVNMMKFYNVLMDV